MDQAMSGYIFQLNPGAPSQAMQEAICHRLTQLKALTVVMETQDFQQHPPGIMQGYAFSLSSLAEELHTLFFALWETDGA